MSWTQFNDIQRGLQYNTVKKMKTYYDLGTTTCAPGNERMDENNRMKPEILK